MKVYSRHRGEMEFSTGAYEPIFFNDGVADLDDELASRLLLDFPELFRQTPYTDAEMIDNTVAPPTTPPIDPDFGTGSISTTPALNPDGTPVEPPTDN